MSINLGLRHDRLLREQAAQMFEKGCGYGLTAKRLGMSAATVREWQKMYHVIGKERASCHGSKAHQIRLRDQGRRSEGRG